jgi:hypothetical protein
LSDMLEFHVRGWELVVSNLVDAAVPAIGPHVRRVVRIGDGRYEIDLPLESQPDRLMTQLSAAGAQIVSLNPIRDTLEDIFVQQVSRPEVAAAARGLEDVR